ncbi:peptidase family M48-domain-containing protein, partial [Globomyces pollinis-pini]
MIFQNLFYKNIGISLRFNSSLIPKLKNQKQLKYFKSRQNTSLYYNKRIWIWVGVVVSLSGIYYVNHLERVPISNRTRFMNISLEQELAIAQSQFNQLMHQYKHQILPDYHPTTKFVRKVASDLIKVSGMTGVNWEVFVIQDKETNAFVLPGGKIFVFTGLLPIAQDADGLAAVLGHEIAHQVARHGAEKLVWLSGIFVARFLISIIFDPGVLFTTLFLKFGLEMPFSRTCEKEADYIGLLLMSKACYDPHAAVNMWERMKLVTGSETSEYLSTHPSNDNRILKIKEWMREAEQQRDESNCSHLAHSYDSFKRLSPSIRFS